MLTFFLQVCLCICPLQISFRGNAANIGVCEQATYTSIVNILGTLVTQLNERVLPPRLVLHSIMQPSKPQFSWLANELDLQATLSRVSRQAQSCGVSEQL